jgi:hypothetical protein
LRAAQAIEAADALVTGKLTIDMHSHRRLHPRRYCARPRSRGYARRWHGGGKFSDRRRRAGD